MTTVRTAFDRQLKMLETDLLRLAELVETQLVEAIKALYTMDMIIAQRVHEFDAALNTLRYEIEERSYTLLALQQPNSGDMRRIVGAVSIATNLERMGDHAAGIARLVLRMNPEAVVINIPEFKDMTTLATTNLRSAMLALGNHDAPLARQIVRSDNAIDALHEHVYAMLIKTMIDNPTTVEMATMLLWVSHNVERFADRVCNICERIIYVVTGNLFEPRTDDMP
ncbi:MAG TPA: phosphate signaling complex protein PhoU [Aggregatilineales bacterium]|nr:phosphate signaling complex protein PhoU [Anaerolineales bacterium]HRE47274.1 phosphate signaling complex protein PhoU [Aggregatilineales bacterium]